MIRLADIPVGEGRAYEIDGELVAVFHLRDGTVRAVSGICPHAGGPLADGLVDLRQVVCPLHQHTFDLATGCSTSGQADLTVYASTVDEEGNVSVRSTTTSRSA
ncbi:Rieske (2Fe-2S) protein [Dactylosporangium matsuzakiense]|uniref:(2Fe-2S)-binding protein n=1 Tax=Dactylosporangium matsuzakiense TaxID=53360 RepID=A0A9W6KPK1_9ACTN|nr:Rieske (2Fe-2S) protein [Dactylosporangium matsuzakiense]UWZ48156.1 Rieske (2Fe-2S) protein [Dactylosporangium matsuzakiense]GLL03174.1 (2Fe-2S)-binding protein [Dactylosporangium matsuzakiense]